MARYHRRNDSVAAFAERLDRRKSHATTSLSKLKQDLSDKIKVLESRKYNFAGREKARKMRAENSSMSLEMYL